MARAAALLVVALLTGCLSHGTSLPQADRALAGVKETPPTPQRFTYCSDHNCEVEHPVSLSDTDWAKVTAALAEAPVDAEAERAAVALSVARFEQSVGPRTGTARDPGGTGIFAPAGDLDCVDEAVNSTRFLVMLDNAGLLRFHRAGWPVHRAFVGNSRTHMTATLQEAGGTRWAVDSWFHASGEPAEVVPIELWLSGWEPDNASL
jgi:hypothetical protein